MIFRHEMDFITQGYRVLESLSGHYLTEDWVSNLCFTYAFDVMQDQYLCASLSRTYPRYRKDLNTEPPTTRFRRILATAANH